MIRADPCIRHRKWPPPEGAFGVGRNSGGFSGLTRRLPAAIFTACGSGYSGRTSSPCLKAGDSCYWTANGRRELRQTASSTGKVCQNKVTQMAGGCHGSWEHSRIQPCLLDSKSRLRRVGCSGHPLKQPVEFRAFGSDRLDDLRPPTLPELCRNNHIDGNGQGNRTNDTIVDGRNSC